MTPVERAELRRPGTAAPGDTEGGGPPVIVPVTRSPPPPAERLLAWADRHRRGLLVAVLLLYAAGFTGKWRVAPDSALYMSLGRNLAEGRGFTYHGVKHNWVEPGLPWVIAGSFRVFGQDRWAPILVFILLCSLAGLLLTYRLMLRHAGRPTAVLVTALLAACETYLRYGFQIVTDTPFVVGVLTFLLGYERLVGTPAGSGSARETGAAAPAAATPARRVDVPAWLMLVAGMAVMVTFRPAVITFVGAVGLATAWHVLRPGPARIRHALIGLLTLGLFLGFRAIDPRRENIDQPVYREERLKDLLTTQRAFALRRMFTETIPGFFEEILPEAVISWELGPGIDSLIALAAIAAGLALVKRRTLWGTWAAATFFQCMFWLPRERYLLPILPLLIYGLWRGAAWLTSRPRLSPRAAGLVMAGLLLVYLGPNLGHDGWFLIEQRLVGIDRTGKGDPLDSPYIELARRMPGFVGERDVVLAEPARLLSYFSRRRVEASLWSLRWPPTPEREARFHEELKKAQTLWAVLPETTRKPHVANLIAALGMRPGPAVIEVEQPGVKDRQGKPMPPLTLHRLEPTGEGREGAPGGG